MRQVLVALAVVSLTSPGCFTYAVHADEPTAENLGILAGVETAAGLGLGITLAAADSRHEWLENLAIGIITPFVVDLAIALGIGASDFVGDARPGVRLRF